MDVKGTIFMLGFRKRQVDLAKEEIEISSKHILALENDLRRCLKRLRSIEAEQSTDPSILDDIKDIEKYFNTKEAN